LRRTTKAASREGRLLILTLSLLVVASPPSHRQENSDILSQRNDNGRTGAYRQTGINPKTFSPENRWGLVTALPVQGAVYAQTLYVGNIRMDGERGQRNVILIATALNNVYTFDADTFTPIWLRRLGPADDFDDQEPFRRKSCAQLSPASLTPTDEHPSDRVWEAAGSRFRVRLGIGIQATPVIDRQAQRMYVSYRTLTNGNLQQRLQALDIRTGAPIQDVEVRTDGFEPLKHRNRASLLLVNGIVYVAFASHCEELSEWRYHGWVFAYEARTLRQVGVLNITPTGNGGGIWQSSTGLAADADGGIYFATGNGSFSADGRNLGNSFVHLDPILTRGADGTVSRVDLRVSDWFTPYRQVWLSESDLDLGLSGVVLISDSHYLTGGGKQGIMYVLDRNNMGRFDQAHGWGARQLDLARAGTSLDWPEDYAADHVVQKFQAGINQHIPPPSSRGGIAGKLLSGMPMNYWPAWPHIHGTPVFAKFKDDRATMYVWPEKDFLKGFRWTGNRFDEKNPLLAVGLDGRSALAPELSVPGGMLSVSVDPTQASGGVVFASVPADSAGLARGSLRAFDAATLRELWNNTGGSPYVFSKFVPPTVARGRVFLATFSNKILVYGRIR
jgi:outer membrane protein assembly factor BamB